MWRLQPEVLAAELSMSLTTTGSFPGGMRDKDGSRLLRTAERSSLGKSAGGDKTNVAAHPEGIHTVHRPRKNPVT